LIAPDHKDTPRIAKIVKKKMANKRTPPSCVTDAIKVPIRIFMEGMVVKVLKGLSSLIVLMLLIDFNWGISVNNELKTTIKSSQFQGFLK